MRYGIGLLVVTILVVTLAACTGQSDPQPSATKAPPNIVILMADDLGYGDLGSYGHPTSRTPNLDTLAAQGQRWTDFYAAAPVCSPSRGALMTGQYPTRSGLYGKRIAVMFPNEPQGIDPELTTLAEALQAPGLCHRHGGKVALR